jgi:hypothetical protein
VTLRRDMDWKLNHFNSFEFELALELEFLWDRLAQLLNWLELSLVLHNRTLLYVWTVAGILIVTCT